MTTTEHLAKASDYIAIAESGDAKIEAYKRAADEIQAARDEDFNLSWPAIAERLGRGESYARRLVRWRTNLSGTGQPPFGGEAENEARYQRADRRKVEQIVQERPEAIAEAIEAAPAEAQREIADRLLTGKKTERSLKSVVQKKVDPPDTPYLPKAEAKLSDGVFKLWEASELLMDETPSDDARVRMAGMAETAQRLAVGIARAVDTGEFDQEFGELVKEVGANR